MVSPPLCVTAQWIKTIQCNAKQYDTTQNIGNKTKYIQYKTKYYKKIKYNAKQLEVIYIALC